MTKTNGISPLVHLARRSGLTLIELVITISLVALLVTIMAPALGALGGVQLKTSASGIAGAIRFGYDLAARKNAVFRMVFDLEEQAYWLEASSQSFRLEREKTEVEQGALAEEEPRQRSSRFVSRADIESGAIWQPRARASFSEYREGTVKKVKLPEGIVIQDVWVQHQADMVTSGPAYLYFFPTGMTERAVIHLADDSQNAYTLLVEGLLGTVKVLPSYVEETLE